jgi:hypothetical protein
MEPRQMIRPALAAAAALALAAALSACSQENTSAPEPAGETTGAMMPDTNAPPAAPKDASGLAQAPDASATGVVPADGSPPPVQPPPDPNAPPAGSTPPAQ